MNYGDHNFIEITQQTKLQVEPVELDFVERVNRLARQSGARRASRAVLFDNVDTRHSQDAWARHVERVESSRVVSSRAKWNLGYTVVKKHPWIQRHIGGVQTGAF